MKRIKVLTFVGLSVITNYIRATGAQLDLRKLEEDFRQNGTDAARQDMIRDITEWVIDKGNPAQASAELNSLAALFDEDQEIYCEADLLCTDSELCCIAAEIVKNSMKHFFKERIQAGTIQRIEALQVEDFELFEEKGKASLVETIEQITAGYKAEEILLNITAGYKAFIPYITIIGQMKRYELIYIYERSRKLVHIPSVIDIDIDKFKGLLGEIKKLDN